MLPLFILRVLFDLYFLDAMSFLLVFLLISHLVNAEESSIWEHATVLTNAEFGTKHSPYQNLIHGTFKELVHTNLKSIDQWFVIDAGKPVRYSRIFIQARNDCCLYMTSSYLCTGNDSSHPQAVGNTCITTPFYDGGFINVESLPEGQFLFYFREGVTSPQWINLAAMRAYQSHNLLEYAPAIIIPVYKLPSSSDPNNLTQHLDVRAGNVARKPNVDADGNEADFNSCFWLYTAENENLLLDDNPFEATFDFGKEVFVTSVLLTLNLFYTSETQLKSVEETQTKLTANYPTQWDIHIGNSADWRQNPKCTLTPLLAANFIDFENAWSITTEGAGANVPAFGFEHWCNMSGEKVTIVSYGVPTVAFGICSLGIFGTHFFRDIPVEPIVEIQAGQTHSIEVEHIKAEYPFAHDLDIYLRQSSTTAGLSFVSLENEASLTKVVIYTTGLTPGSEHTLVLESFDATSDVKSTLKMDTIQIIIPEDSPSLPSFTSSVETQAIYSGTQLDWSLPEIDLGLLPLTEVRVDPDPLIDAYVSFNSDLNVMQYDGEEIGALTQATLVNIDIALVNSIGENPYTQKIFVFPSLDVDDSAEQLMESQSSLGQGVQATEGETQEEERADSTENDTLNDGSATLLNSGSANSTSNDEQNGDLEEEIPSAQSPPKIERDQTVGEYYASLLRAAARARAHASALAGSLEDNIKMPEAILVDVSQNAEVRIKFTKKIKFPDEVLKLPGQNQTGPSKIADNNASNSETAKEVPINADSLFTVQMMETDSETLSNNLKGWKIASITQTEVRITLDFEKPLEVSQGDNRDQILVFASFGAYTDQDGLRMPEFQFLQEELPRQNPSAEIVAMAGVVGATSSTATEKEHFFSINNIYQLTATATVLSSTYFLNLLFTASMNGIWILLNSVQLIVFVPMFQGLKFPVNASEMNKGLIKVATFDIIDTGKWFDPLLFDLGEGEPFSSSFEDCTYETTWLLDNSSVILWTFVLHGFGFLIYLLLHVYSSRTGKFKSLTKRFQGYFVFNGPLRLIMETFLDLYLSSMLNAITAEEETENTSIKVSNYLAYGVCIFLSVLVLLLAVLYCRKFSDLGPESTYGALLDGTNNDSEEKSKWILLFPALFFARRISFTLSVLLLQDKLWVQIAIQFAFSTTMVIYLMSAWPLESSFATKMEIKDDLVN